MNNQERMNSIALSSDRNNGSTVNDDLIRELMVLLRQNAKHSAYQMLPDCLGVVGTDLAQGVGFKRQDDKRYNWLASKLTNLSGTVVDIGANLGYFTFQLLKDYSVDVIAYEPYEPHARVISIIRELCGYKETRLRVMNQGVGLREIDLLPESNLLLLLNVIQHAGEDYDADLVRTVDEWRNYAISYLAKLRDKTDMLFFQMGYTWLGHDAKLCSDDEIIDFTAKLLTDAGWTIKHCGVISKHALPITYEDYSVSLTSHNPVYLGERKRSLLPKLTARLQSLLSLPSAEKFISYRFAQRPLWLCER